MHRNKPHHPLFKIPTRKTLPLFVVPKGSMKNMPCRGAESTESTAESSFAAEVTVEPSLFSSVEALTCCGSSKSGFSVFSSFLRFRCHLRCWKLLQLPFTKSLSKLDPED
ncbi:hypothetical protein VIGAN_05058900 [Vigna angularis var. angularis]|uniref:Uncharacterized protein n=1 Tax=Vigna angularis var. angularis TaxID=157739 RepID=A0A0S3S357_PHAAN|nr:hypothetical protein VIGAN_05058900 [Vigna angularis var. angularis]